MSQTNPLIHHSLRHLIATIGSFALLLISLFVVTPLLTPSLFRLADRISSTSSDSYFHMAFLEWHILLMMIVTTELIRRRFPSSRLWLIAPMMALLFSLIGFAGVAIEQWAALQNREFATIFMSLSQAQQYGIWAFFYYPVYIFSGKILGNIQRSALGEREWLH